MLVNASLLDSLLSLPSEQRAELLQSLSDEDALSILFDWRGVWARQNQIAPPGGWYLWLILAGRGFGKSRTGAEWSIEKARNQPGSRGALVAETPADVRDVMIEGESGILACSPPWFFPHWEPTKRLLTWPNGTTAHTYSAFNFEELRGPQHHWGWADELCKWTHPKEAWDQFAFGLRLPPHAQSCVTTTPRPIPLLKKLLKRASTVTTRGSTYENLNNLADNVRAELLETYEGTRLGRQELHAEVLEDLEGALWSHDMLDKLRVKGAVPVLQRIVVAVDPSGGAGEQGIVVAGRHNVEVPKAPPKACAVVLDDRSCKLSPDGWGRKAVQAAIDFQADCIVAETNFGGDMVQSVVETAAREMGVTIRVKKITASRAKHVRAEPIAALYEQSRVQHVRCFAQLEDQLCLFTPGGWMGDGSPDRADAAIWALTELMVGPGVPSAFETKTKPIRPLRY